MYQVPPNHKLCTITLFFTYTVKTGGVVWIAHDLFSGATNSGTF